MAKLVVFHQGTEFARLNLEPGQEYTIGRDAECDITLEHVKGISRQHVKLIYIDDNWNAQVLSRFGKIVYAGDEIDELLLDVDIEFHIPPFTFSFYIKDDQPEVLEETNKPKVGPEDILNDGVEKAILAPEETPQPVGAELMLDDASTAAGGGHLTGVLKWRDKEGKKIGFKISDTSCTVGRGKGCDVRIKHKLMSRRHFEISRAGSDFYIVDLGSANGTQLNGKGVSKNQPVKIDSGDRISVMTIKFNFEIVDEQFQHKLKNAPAAAANPLSLYQGMPQAPTAAGAKIVKVSKSGRRRPSSALNSDNKNVIKYALMIMVPMFLYLGLSGGPEKQTNKQELSTSSVPFEKLSSDQQTAVKDTFNLINNLWGQRKYALCLEEVRKLHLIIPFYENSKEFKRLCRQGLESERADQEIARKDEEKRMAEARIQAIAEDCNSKFNSLRTMDDAKSCISMAMEIDPEHPQVVEFLNRVELRNVQLVEKQAKKAQKERKIQEGLRAYQTAKGLLSSKRYRKAINAYKKFLSRSYPDPKRKRPVAKRELATARVKLKQKVRIQFDACKRNYNERKYKEAIIACQKALKEDPQSNEVKNFELKVRTDLRRDMKMLYEDSILEENLGNIEAAKEKWKKIRELSIKEENYYEKADNKLRKYGIGL